MSATSKILCQILPTYIFRLEYLALAGIYAVTDRSICTIAKNLQLLNHLDIRGCWRVTDTSVHLLAEYCKNLKALQVESCRDVSYQCIEKLVRKGVHVDKLLQSKGATQSSLNYLRALPM